MLYPFTCDIKDGVYGNIIIPDFDCEVEIEARIVCGELETHCKDVLVDGKTLRHGSKFAHDLFTVVSTLAEADIETAGGLWDRVSAEEGIYFSGNPNDPDAHWVQPHCAIEARERAAEERAERMWEAAE